MLQPLTTVRLNDLSRDLRFVATVASDYFVSQLPLFIVPLASFFYHLLPCRLLDRIPILLIMSAGVRQLQPLALTCRDHHHHFL